MSHDAAENAYGSMLACDVNNEVCLGRDRNSLRLHILLSDIKGRLLTEFELFLSFKESLENSADAAAMHQRRVVLRTCQFKREASAKVKSSMHFENHSKLYKHCNKEFK